MFRHGWDTRTRNLEALRLLDSLAGNGLVLDAGGGDTGLSGFSSRKTVGIDIDVSTPTVRTMCRATVCRLPFRDGSMPLVACVDVLEYFQGPERAEVISELVRVAGVGIVLGFPQGEAAQRSDRSFAAALDRRSKPRPDWLDDHLRQPSKPTIEEVHSEVTAAATRLGRGAERVALRYSEPLALNRLLRAAAVRTTSAYAATNLALGVASRAWSWVPLRSGYRAFLAYRVL
jgi:hypothetical protein